MIYDRDNEGKKSRQNSSWVFFISFSLMLVLLDSRYMGGANVPVIILLLNFFFHPSIVLEKGRLMRFFHYYLAYLFVATIFNYVSNYDPDNSILYFVEVLIILFSCSIAVRHMNYDSFFMMMRNMGLIFFMLDIIEAIIKTPFLCNLLGKKVLVDPTGYRTFVIFGHPIVCGLFLLFFWIVLLLYPLRKASFNVAAIILGILAIMFTRSRSIWLSAAIVVVCYSLKRAKKSGGKIKKKTINIIISVIFFYFVIDLCSEFSVTRWIYTYVSSRLVGSFYAGEGQGNIIRVDTMLNSIKYWNNGNQLKMIFGMGKNYDKYFMKLFPVIKWGQAWTAAIDNQYFTTVHEAGLIGLFFFIAIFVIAIVRFVKLDKEDKVGITSNLTIIGIAVSNFFYEGLNYISVLTLLVTCMIMSDRRHSNSIYLKSADLKK